MHPNHQSLDGLRATVTTLGSSVTSSSLTSSPLAAACAVLFVLEQQRHARERLGAGPAPIPLDVGMCLQVRPQVRSVGKRAVAVGALERALAGVRPQVPLQQPRPGERLAALRTTAGQRVSPDVHLERPDRRIGLGSGNGGRGR